MAERRAQPQPRDGAMAAIEVMCERMTWMEEPMGATPPTPPPKLLPPLSQDPQGMQNEEGPPDDSALYLLKKLVGCMTAIESTGTLPAATTTATDQRDQSPVMSSTPMAPTQEAASTAEQQSGKGHPPGLRWPTDSARQRPGF